MRKLVIAAAIILVAGTACKKTGEGEYEVQKPVVGVQTDTINTPTVDIGTDTVTVQVPTVDVNAPKQK